jgi:hypothetical protein
MFPIRSPYHQEQRQIDVRSEVEACSALTCRRCSPAPTR